MSASRVIWADDGLGAAILGSRDEWLAHLQVDNSYVDYRREPELAWVVSWLDSESAEPLMLTAAVEQPAALAQPDHSPGDRDLSLLTGQQGQFDGHEVSGLRRVVRDVERASVGR
jgi:hypothetical protein